jgi:hypothetical protein
MAPLRIVALEGDQTGQELLEQALRVLTPEVLGIDWSGALTFKPAPTETACATRARDPRGLRARGDGTPEGAVTSAAPTDAREALDGKVIVRIGCGSSGDPVAFTTRSRSAAWRSGTW